MGDRERDIDLINSGHCEIDLAGMGTKTAIDTQGPTLYITWYLVTWSRCNPDATRMR